MKQWSARAAKARFSELLKASVEQGPQVITKNGAPTAVLVSFAEWQQLQATQLRVVKPVRTLKELLLADEPRFDFDLPKRGELFGRRDPTRFDD